MYKQYAWYLDPNSSDSTAILLTRLLYCTKCQSQKREILQRNTYKILPSVNQVIYTLDTVCEPNIMILAQVVLQIFCSQDSICLHCKSWKKIGKSDIIPQWQVRSTKFLIDLIEIQKIALSTLKISEKGKKQNYLHYPPLIDVWRFPYDVWLGFHITSSFSMIFEKRLWYCS